MHIINALELSFLGSMPFLYFIVSFGYFVRFVLFSLVLVLYINNEASHLTKSSLLLAGRSKTSLEYIFDSLHLYSINF